MENNDIKEPKKSINWFLIITSLLMITSSFFAWSSSGIIFYKRSDGLSYTLLDFDKFGPMGYVLIVLSIANIILSFLGKRRTTYIITGLISIISTALINAGIKEAYYDPLEFGFYMFVAGLVLSIVAHCVFYVIIKKKS